MRAGLLNEPITILTSVVTVNDYGEEETVWETKFTTKAHVLHDGGTRTDINDEIVYTNLKTFEVRYYVPILEFDRIIWEGKTYRVLNIDPNRDKQKLTIRAELVND